MKAKYFLSLCLVACATMASAQFVSKSAYSIYETEDGWQGVRVSYKPTVMEVQDEGDLDMTGVSIDYVKSFRIGGNSPVFLETGVGVQWNQYLDSAEEYYEGIINVSVEEKWTLASINVPVNVAYQCFLSDKLLFTPFVGLNLRGYVLGEMNVVAKASYEGESAKEEETFNFFDDDDMSGNPCKRMILGWHIGASFTYNRISLGVSYGSDFTEFTTDTKFTTTAVTLGVNF